MQNQEGLGFCPTSKICPANRRARTGRFTERVLLSYVCVEFLNIDLSAWVRLRMFHSYYEGAVPVHVIAVLNDQRQVNDLYRYLGCYYTEMAVVLDRKAILSCMYKDLGCEKKLFTVTDPFGTEKLYHSESCTYKELHCGYSGING